jgi:hypothetical protein
MVWIEGPGSEAAILEQLEHADAVLVAEKHGTRVSLRQVESSPPSAAASDS